MLIEFFNDGFSDLEFVIKLVLCNRDKVSFEFEKRGKSYGFKCWLYSGEKLNFFKFCLCFIFVCRWKIYFLNFERLFVFVCLVYYWKVLCLFVFDFVKDFLLFFCKKKCICIYISMYFVVMCFCKF